ncbi:MAG TPA: hypothetical protein VL527_02385 [Dongiaceae bacterium]|jgi:hypothetical protein|nr:hypothetical protein [Dongiaceae bacterium]
MKKSITEDSANGMVLIGDISVPGWIDDVSCGHCGAARIYHEDYDAYFCPTCNLWLERQCGDATCSYCSKRPDKPLPNQV